MINKLGYDIFNRITLFLLNYKDINSLKRVNRNTYYHIYENKEIEVYVNNQIDLPKLEKIIFKNTIVSKIPIVKICILIDCVIKDIINIRTISSLHIRDCLSYCNPLGQYDSLIAIYLYNFTIDPDELFLPNLEYLCIYESDYDDSYVYMFNVERFPKLKYLDLCRIYMDNENVLIPFLEYYNGYFQNYNMPNLKYIEWNSELLNESKYLELFPNLEVIITSNIPVEYFNKIKIIDPSISNIAKNYYNKYFLLEKN